MTTVVKEESNDLQALSPENISSLYCSVFEKSQNIIFIAQDTRVLLVNSAIKALGYTVPEVLDPDFNVFNLIVPEQRDEIQKIFTEDSSEKSRVTFSFETIALKKDGTRMYVLLNTSVVHINGRRAVLGIVTDITSRKRLELRLGASERNYRSLLHNFPDGIVLLNRECRVRFANRTVERYLDFTVDEHLPDNFDFLLVVDPPSKLPLKDYVKNALTGVSVPDLIQFSLISRQGAVLPFLARSSPVFFEDEVVLQCVLQKYSQVEESSAIFRHMRYGLLSEISMICYKFGNRGPEVVVTEDIPFVDDKELFFVQTGVVCMALVGDGTSYHQGLFGPLPVPGGFREHRSLVFSFKTQDRENAAGTNYCMLVLIFPVEFEILFGNFNAVRRSFLYSIKQIRELSDITIEWLKQTKSRVVLGTEELFL